MDSTIEEDRGGQGESKQTRLSRRLSSRSRKNALSVHVALPPEGPVPLTFAQRRMWLLAHLDPESAAYNLACSAMLTGPLRRDVLDATFTEIVRRHEPLRTTYHVIDGEPMQIVAPPQPYVIPYVDLRALPLPEREAELERLAREDTTRPFDLENGPVFRLTMVVLEDERHAALLTFHHIAIDGWGLAIFTEELASIYGALLAGEAVDAREMPYSYRQFALAQSAAFTGGALEEDLAYWKRHLSGASSALEAMFDRPRPPQFSMEGDEHRRTLTAETMRKLKAAGRKSGATSLATLMSVFYALLARYTGSDDLILGTPVAGRTATETSGLIGFFVNTLALRVDLSGDPTFSEIVARVKTSVRDGFAHADAPFERVVEAMNPERGSKRPLIDVALSVRDPFDAWRDFGGMTVLPFPTETRAAPFDLTLECRKQEDGGLELVFNYRTAPFDPATIAAFAGSFTTLVESVIRDPGERLSRLVLVDPANAPSVLVSAHAEPAPPRTIHAIFEERAGSNPDAPAISDGGTTWSYRDLDSRAERIAAALGEEGIGSGALVAVCALRSADAIAAMLGILKAGAAYLPLDANHPAERLEFMLAQARAAAVLADAAGGKHLGSYRGRQLDIAAIVVRRTERAALLRAPAVRPDERAYVMYTSGSTGRPKGVVVSHAAVTNLTVHTDLVRLSPADRVAHSTTLAFDVANCEIWGALLCGAAVVVCPHETLLDPPAYASFLARESITTAFLTPAVFNVIARMRPDAFARLHTLVLGGDTPDPRALHNVFVAGKPQRVLNAYGPTEATTFATAYEIADIGSEKERVPIGRPLAGMRAYVLDAARRPVPAGVPGELYVGGAGVADGYLNDEEATAERFVPDPFANEERARMYRTGDRVRVRTDGELDFLGRFDRQVKLRGVRVELPEIEAVLRHDERVEACVVTVEGDADDPRLAAYVVPRTAAVAVDAAALKKSLATKLPPAMIPASLTFIERLPLDPNGKVDTGALASAPPIHLPDETAVGMTVVHYQLIDLWQKALGVAPIGIHDDFFALGGHSLLAARMIADLDEIFDVQIPLVELLEEATIARLADLLIRQASRVARDPLVKFNRTGTKAPFFFLHGALAGDGFFCRPLAKALGPDQPFFVLEPHGAGGTPIPPTVEAMATDYLRRIRDAHPRGPYRVGGFCNSGLVAFEIARMLAASGETVERVILLDTLPFGVGYGWLERSLAWQPLRLSLWQRQRIFAALVRRCNEAILAAAIGPRTLVGKIRADFRPQQPLRGLLEGTEREGYDLEGAMRVLSRAYVPRRFPGRLDLLFSEEVRTASDFDPTYGWKYISSGTTIRPIPGDHLTCVGLHVETVAEQMRHALDGAHG